jgi:thiamine transport system substrate-binding protein
MSNSISDKNKWLLIVVGVCIAVFAVTMGRSFMQLKENRSQRVRAANLIVYTHSSFIDAYGPGAELKAEFEKTCDCTVEYVDVGGAQAAIEKIKLDPSRRVDVLLGVDLLLLARLANSVRVQDINRPDINWSKDILPYVYSRFIPYDWSPMGFIYDKQKVKSASSLSDALLNLPKATLALQDPVMSAPGLNWLYWLYTVSENKNDLEKNILNMNKLAHSYSPSWSAAYGLFRKNQAPMVFSYLTSLIYHWENDKNSQYDFMTFSEGHPVQIEYAAVPDACWNCAVAKRFVEFLVSPYAQKRLVEKNYMLPVSNDVVLPEIYQRLPKTKNISNSKLEEFTLKSNEILTSWDASRR